MTSVVLCGASFIPINRSRGRRVRLAESFIRHFGGGCKGNGGVLSVPRPVVPRSNKQVVDVRSPADGVDGSSGGAGKCVSLLSRPGIVHGGVGDTIASSDNVVRCSGRGGPNVSGLLAVFSTFASGSVSRLIGRFTNSNCNGFGRGLTSTVVTRLRPVRVHCCRLLDSGRLSSVLSTKTGRTGTITSRALEHVRATVNLRE